MEKIFQNSILLSAVGDAMGWITEFEKSQNSLHRKYGVTKVEKFYNWKKTVGGRFNGYEDDIKEGSYSDDTQLLLAVARSVEKRGEINHDYFAKVELPSWYSYSRGAGRTIKNAAQKIQRVNTKWNNNFFTFKAGDHKVDYRNSGANGAAMRILPIALVHKERIETGLKEIFRNSIITHGHPRAIIGALLYGYMFSLNYQGSETSPMYIIEELGKKLKSRLSIDLIRSDQNLVNWMEIWNEKYDLDFTKIYEKSLEETLHYLRIIYKSIRDDIEYPKVAKDLGCFNPETKGSGLSTVIAGIFLALNNNKNPLEGIKKGVNLIGTDTDSIAAFAGGLSGFINKEYEFSDSLKALQDYDYLGKVSKYLWEIYNNNYSAIYIRDLNNKERINDFFTQNELKVGNEVTYHPLGPGTIKNITRKDTISKGKYNLIVDVEFKIGQSCRFHKLMAE